MQPYFNIFYILAVFSIFDLFRRQYIQLKGLFFIYTILLLTFFAGLRCGDQDYLSYGYIFDLIRNTDIFNVTEGTSIYYIEPGFKILIKVITLFPVSNYIIFIIIAFIAVTLNLISAKKYSPYIFLTIIWYFAHTFVLKEMIQIRAGLACAICLFSIRFITEKKIIKFIISIIIAMSFHSAAIVFSLAYIFCQIKTSKKLLSILLIIAIFIGQFLPLGSFIHLFGIEKINLYVGSALYNRSIGIFSNPTTIKSILITSMCLLNYENMRVKLPHFEILFKIYLLSTIWLILFNDFAIIAGRVATFWSITEIILVPSFLLLMKKNLSNQFIGWISIVLIAKLILYLNFITQNIIDYVLYPIL